MKSTAGLMAIEANMQQINQKSSFDESKTFVQFSQKGSDLYFGGMRMGGVINDS